MFVTYVFCAELFLGPGMSLLFFKEDDEYRKSMLIALIKGNHDLETTIQVTTGINRIQ